MRGVLRGPSAMSSIVRAVGVAAAASPRIGSLRLWLYYRITKLLGGEQYLWPPSRQSFPALGGFWGLIALAIWYCVQEKKSKAKKKEDPMGGIMDLMKDMYDTGDEKMKETIGKAMYDSRMGKKNSGGGDDAMGGGMGGMGGAGGFGDM